MTPEHILVVEDEAGIREMMRFALERAGFRVSEASDAQAGRLVIADDPPQLLLLDWMLPATSGAEFARELRREELTRGLPIIMVTARGAEADRVRGLNLGCDDYVCKPFSTSELVARVRALLRRAPSGTQEEILAADGLTLDTASHRAAAGEQGIRLGPTEFRLLRFFMNNPERVYTREQMLDRVWGRNVYVEERTVDVHIRRLRKALAPFGFDRFIQTVRGSGYRFSTRPG
ncbi:MAG: phosphate regulon transcriptional regulator PhoB [Salinisphaera sp.]|nr:phosphate regulon transcriptional regulator PhoB [Salinisphaera sp.]